MTDDNTVSKMRADKKHMKENKRLDVRTMQYQKSPYVS